MRATKSKQYTEVYRISAESIENLKKFKSTLTVVDYDTFEKARDKAVEVAKALNSILSETYVVDVYLMDKPKWKAVVEDDDYVNPRLKYSVSSKTPGETMRAFFYSGSERLIDEYAVGPPYIGKTYALLVITVDSDKNVKYSMQKYDTFEDAGNNGENAFDAWKNNGFPGPRVELENWDNGKYNPPIKVMRDIGHLTAQECFSPNEFIYQIYEFGK